MYAVFLKNFDTTYLSGDVGMFFFPLSFCSALPTTLSLISALDNQLLRCFQKIYQISCFLLPFLRSKALNNDLALFSLNGRLNTANFYLDSYALNGINLKQIKV